jgi:hypothetical protein
MPSDDQVARAIELIRASETNYRYFFDQLDDPSWLSPLAERGFFRSPPDLVTTDDGRSYFPDWPESRALLRLAPQAPERVFELLEAVDARHNDQVRADIVRAAAVLPVEMASRLAAREASWLAAQSVVDFGLPASFGELITAIARGGALDAAYELTAALFGVLPSGQRVGWLGVKARMEAWEYRETAQAVFGTLLDLDGQRTLALAEDLLEEAMALGAGGAENAPVDHSDIWRPAIEDRAENLGEDASEALIVLVRDLARDAVAAQPDQVDEILARMRHRAWHVFWRIGLYLLADLSRSRPAIARQWLLDRELFFCERTRHEYLGLARVLVPTLDEGELSVWRSMLDEGPQYEGLATRDLREAANVDDEAWLRMQERWRRDRLAVLAGVLPEEMQGELTALVERQGESEDPDLPTITSWVGPTSPVSADELRSMSAEQVIGVLAEWQPGGEHLAPSPEGLARRVTDRVAEGPEGFTERWREVLDLEPTYARSILGGLDKAVREGLAVEWGDVLSLSEGIIVKPDEPASPQTEWNDRDPDWSWSRKAVAGLLVLSIERRVIPAVLAARTWDVIEPLTWDGDPGPGYETSMDPLTFSINTTRGQAMHAAIALGGWLATQVGREVEDADILVRIRENLESHLDPEKERSPAVRATFGARMAALINIGEDWFERQLPALFPEDPALLPLRLAVWESFLAWTHPHQAFLRTLRPYYAQAAADLGATTGAEGLGRDPRLGLAEHLASYYLWGYISLDDRDLLATFFDAAPTTTEAHVISFLGRLLDREEDAIPEDTAQRLMDFWVWLVARLAPEENPDRRPVFEPFGWWFGAGQLDPTWELEQLDSIVSQQVVVDPEFRVLPRLLRLLPDNPLGVLVALKHYLEAGGPGWRLASASQEIRAILAAAPTAEDARVANEVQQIANLMIARGMIDFRDFTQPG